MMTRNRIQLTLIALAATFMAAPRIDADQACSVLSVGAQIGANPGSVMIVGQTAIGFATDGNTNLYAGALHCLSGDAGAGCLLGDVDNNGLIDGRDIDEYLMVYIDGLGTPQQICAANIEVADFVALLLAQ